MKDKHIVTLLEIQLKHDRAIGRLYEALGRRCDIHEIFPLDLLDIVADLLGVPEDNTSEYYNEDTGTYTDGYYCRDWTWDRWLEWRGFEDPINAFIDIIREDTKEYYKEKE